MVLGPVSTIAMAQTVPAPVEVSDEVLEEAEGQWIPVVIAVVRVAVKAAAGSTVVQNFVAGAATAAGAAVSCKLISGNWDCH